MFKFAACEQPLRWTCNNFCHDYGLTSGERPLTYCTGHDGDVSCLGAGILHHCGLRLVTHCIYFLIATPIARNQRRWL
jgi:hypothetical protein